MKGQRKKSCSSFVRVEGEALLFVRFYWFPNWERWFSKVVLIGHRSSCFDLLRAGTPPAFPGGQAVQAIRKSPRPDLSLGKKQEVEVTEQHGS